MLDDATEINANSMMHHAKNGEWALEGEWAQCPVGSPVKCFEKYGLELVQFGLIICACKPWSHDMNIISDSNHPGLFESHFIDSIFINT